MYLMDKKQFFTMSPETAFNHPQAAVMEQPDSPHAAYPVAPLPAQLLARADERATRWITVEDSAATS